MIFGCKQYNKLFYISSPDSIVFYIQSHNFNFKYNFIYVDYRKNIYVWKFIKHNKYFNGNVDWIEFHSYNELLILLKEFINFFETHEKL